MREAVEPISWSEVEAARARLEGLSLFAPLLNFDAPPAGKAVMLKLENLQPIGSFKIRPIGNAVLAKARSELAGGIFAAILQGRLPGQEPV